MDFMHQTVASTIVKYFTWLFDNDGYINGTHLFISMNILVLFYFVKNLICNVFYYKYTLDISFMIFITSTVLYLTIIFPPFYFLFVLAWKYISVNAINRPIYVVVFPKLFNDKKYR